MNSKTKLILEYLDWVAFNITPRNEEQKNIRGFLQGKTQELFFPTGKPTIQDKTKHIFGKRTK